MRSDTRILSQPCVVHWAGWRSDTYRLQNAGWQIAVDYNPMEMSYTLALKHPNMGLYAITSATEFQWRDAMDLRGGRLPEFHVTHCAPKINVVEMPVANLRFDHFNPIDARPCFTERSIKSLEDFNIFNVQPRQAEEILIDKADMTVLDHLQAIKDLQSVKQAELRQKQLHGFDASIKPRTELVANLVAVAA